MKVLVVGACPVAGSVQLYRRLADSVDRVIAADAAGEWCVDAGHMPDAVLGDFDSALPGAAARLAANGVRVHTFPVAKDASDLDLCVAEALRSGATDVTLTACTAGRLDHALAALGTLARVSGASGRIIEPTVGVHVLHATDEADLCLEAEPGATVSVMAMGVATGVTLGGMRYPLHDAVLGAFSSLGLSNIASEPVITVAVATGTLLIIVNSRV